MKIAWTQRARQDLAAIGRYIAKDKSGAAGVFMARLRDRTEQLKRHPHSGRVVPEFQRENLREIIHGNYRIVYRIHKTVVEILSIQEGHRPLHPRRVAPAGGAE